MKKTLSLLAFIVSFYCTYAQDGSPDPAFGTNGMVTVPVKLRTTDNSISADKIVQLPQGGYIVASSSYYSDISYGNHVYLSKFDKNGLPDKSFGKKGTIEVFPDLLYFSIAALAVDSTGKIVITTDASALNPDANFTIAKFKADGSGPDSSFGNNGVFTYINRNIHVKAQPDALVILPNNKILVSGSFRLNNVDECAIIRLQPNGLPDKTFNGTGFNYFQYKTIGVAGGDYYYNSQPLGVQPDGKILVTFVDIARFNSNGTRDLSFGTGGLVTCNKIGNYREILHSLAVLPDGSFMYLADEVQYFDDGGGFSTDRVYRYTKNGTIDSSFATNGVLAIYNNYLFFELPPAIGCLTVQPDYKFLVSNAGPDEDFSGNVITRYLKSGNPDSTFANNGNLPNPVTQYSELLVSQVLLQKDSKIVTLAYPLVGVSVTGYYYISRYLNSVVPQNIVAGSTTVRADNFSVNKPLPAVLLSPNPATDHLTISGLNNKVKSVIQILNAQGKPVLQANVQDAQYNLKLDNFSAGIYYVIVSENNTITVKQAFIKQ